MLSYGAAHDLAGIFDTRLALIPATITAAAGNDGAYVNGPAIDLLANNRILFRDGVLVVSGRATLAAAETLTLKAKVQTCAASNFGSGVVDLEPEVVVGVVATGPGGGGTVNWTAKIKVKNFEGHLQYLRAAVFLDLSAGSVDTVAASAIFVLGGATNMPPV